MITSLDEALEQNKLLFAEAFRINQMYSQSQAELLRLKSSSNPGAPELLSNSENFSSRAEALLKEKEETNLKMALNLKHVKQQLNDVQSQAREANIQLEAFKKTGGNENIVAEMKAQMKEKDHQLLEFSNASMDSDRLLASALTQVQKINDERLLMIEHSKKLKLSSFETERLLKSSEQKLVTLNELLAAKEKELMLALSQNYQLANMIFKLEIQVKKIPELEEQLEAKKNDLKKIQNYQAAFHAQKAAICPQVPASPDYNNPMFMTQMMENMKQMQIEIFRLNQQQMMQNH